MKSSLILLSLSLVSVAASGSKKKVRQRRRIDIIDSQQEDEQVIAADKAKRVEDEQHEYHKFYSRFLQDFSVRPDPTNSPTLELPTLACTFQPITDVLTWDEHQVSSRSRIPRLQSRIYSQSGRI